MAAAPQALDLEAVNLDLEQRTPEAILQWTWERFRPDVMLTCSFQHDGVVLAHMLRQIAPAVPVVFINTGFHFPETLAYRDEIVKRFDLKLVELLRRYLPGMRAWINGRRRDQAATRQRIAVVEAYEEGLSKVNPLASWNSRDTFYYMQRHDIPL